MKDNIISTKRDANIFFTEILNSKDPNDALKQAFKRGNANLDYFKITNMLDTLKQRINALETQKQDILAKFKSNNVVSIDGIIQAGKELELIRVKIWAIEEAIHG